MTFDLSGLGLAAAGLPLLRDLVHERTGLFYDEGRLDTLADRLSPLVLERGFASYLDFYYLLKYDAGADAAWAKVLDALGVQETYFWREIDQIRAVACHVLPQLWAQPRSEPIRILSLPCATGEEPLTIAMVLEQGGAFTRGPIEIHGADGSHAAIARAREAHYGSRAFRSLPPELFDRYFTRERDQRGSYEREYATPIPALRARITSLQVVNLMALEPIADLIRGCHVVFCRNAFIYFSPQSVTRVVNTLADLMPTPAFLCVGASESLLNITDRFLLEDVGGAFMYVKR